MALLVFVPSKPRAPLPTTLKPETAETIEKIQAKFSGLQLSVPQIVNDAVQQYAKEHGVVVA